MAIRPGLIYRLVLPIVLLAFALTAAGCGGAGGDGITVAGSTSVQPFAELLSEEYDTLHPDQPVNVQGGGSSAGIEAARSGAAQIGMSSRDLQGDELKLTQVEIARDAIAVVVHPSNQIKDLKLDQVRGVFSGKITRWSQLGGPNRPIVVVTREEGSGTRSAFQELVMGKADVDAGALVQDSNGAVRQLVSDNPDAIGYVSLGLVNDKVKAISLDGIQPTAQHVAEGSYRLVRPFLFVLKAPPPSGSVADGFVKYVLSPEGQKILAQEGLLPPAKK